MGLDSLILLKKKKKKILKPFFLFVFCVLTCILSLWYNISVIVDSCKAVLMSELCATGDPPLIRYRM